MAAKHKNVDELVLILAPTGRDAPLTSAALAKSGLESKICRTVADLCTGIRSGAGTAVIAHEALTEGDVAGITEVLRAQPPWADFPFVVFTMAGEQSSAQLRSEGILGQLGNVTMLERPVRIQTLVSALDAVLRNRRRQYQVRDLLLLQEKLVNRFALLAELASMLLSTEQPQEKIDELLEKICRQLGLDFCFNYLFDDETQNFRLQSHFGISAATARKMEFLESSPMDAQGAVMPGMLHQHEDSLQASHNAWKKSMGIVGYATYPLIAKGRVMGTVSFASRIRQQFFPDELSFFETVCNQIAIALERKRAEEKIQAFNQVLERRVEERTTALRDINEQMQAFTYSVSHDLQAPLRSIRSFSEILLTEHSGQLDSTGQDYLKRVVKSAVHMHRLITDLLTYSRLSREEYTPEPLNLEACIQVVIGLLSQDIKNRNAQVVIDKPIPPVLAQAAPLEQIISNLLSNALKFVSPGTTPRVRFWAEAREGVTRLWVEDNGIGIAPQHQEKIFGVFERLHTTYPGTGMGLAIVRKAVERMGGKVTVESALQKGSRFRVDLPAIPPTGDPADGASADERRREGTEVARG